MQIPRSYVERYSRALNAVSGRATASLEDALMRIDYTADVALARNAVVAVMQSYCGASATLAARLAADFYDGLRLWSGIEDGFRASVQTTRSPAATEGAVRAFVQDLVDQRPVEQFVGKCVDRLDYETRLSANRCIEYNARRDPKKPKWARVPTGPETCEFCMMLASRGFAYHTEDTASHAHAHCDCRIVPGWDGVTSVAGYDPDYYYDVYRHPERHPEVRDAINARRRERRLEREDVSVDTGGARIAGAVSGALNDDNDPNGTRREAHAESYYREIRSRDGATEVARVANNSGVGEAVVRQAYDHVFINEHDLADGHRRFDPNYYMSQSWQRLSTGVGIQDCDLYLIYHEAIESELMESGMSYTKAHDTTCEMGYDWWQKYQEWMRSERRTS